MIHFRINQFLQNALEVELIKLLWYYQLVHSN